MNMIQQHLKSLMLLSIALGICVLSNSVSATNIQTDDIIISTGESIVLVDPTGDTVPGSGDAQTELLGGGPCVESVAVEPSGTIVFVNFQNCGWSLPRRIMRLDLASGALSVVTTGGILSEPICIEVDKSGDIYVMDIGAGALIKVDPAGDSAPGTGDAQSIVTSGGYLVGPECFAIEANGDFVVSDFDAEAVIRVNASGDSIPGSGDAQTLVSSGGYFGAIDGIAVAQDGNIYVGSVNNKLLVRVSPSGDSSPGAGDAQTLVSSDGLITSPFGIAVERDGNILVGQFSRSNLLRVDPIGDSSPGAGDAQTIVTAAPDGSFSVTVVPPLGVTNTGEDVVVEPPVTDENGDSLEDAPSVVFEFDEVTSDGETTVTVVDQGPPPPTGFKLIGLTGGATYFDLESTATFNGTIEICIDYSGMTVAGDPANLSLAHEEDGIWVDITTSNDTTNRIICGVTSSFSFFAIVELADPITLLSELVEAVAQLNARKGIINSLDAKLDAAEKALTDAVENNDHAAINVLLSAFTNSVEAQRGNQISDAEADDLVSRAEEIALVLGGVTF